VIDTVRHHWVRLAAVGLLTLLAVLGGWTAWTTSPTFDESGHIVCGYAWWQADKPRMPSANLVLSQRWMTLPLLWSKPQFPLLPEINAGVPRQQDMGFLLLFRDGNDWAAIVRPCRAMILLAAVLLGWGLFRWSRALWGDAGGLITLTLYCLCPEVLAHGGLATTDLMTAVLFAVAVHLFWGVLHRLTLFRLLATGLAIGALLSVKLSALLFVPMALAMLLVRLGGGAPLLVRERAVASGGRTRVALLLACAGLVLMAWATMWGAYGFRYSADIPGVSSMVQWGLDSDRFVDRAVDTLRSGRWLPEAYLFDLHLFSLHTARWSYLFGDYSTRGWWTFFPAVYLYKTPLPTLAILAAALGAFAQFRRIRAQLYALTPWLVLLVVYLGVAIVVRFNVGSRHLLPTYAPLFIVAGAAAAWDGRKWARGALLASVVWLLAENLRVGSDHMAYFNELAGGPGEGHRVLVDSSLEWGQHLPALETWLTRRADSTPVYFAYFGYADLRRFRLDRVTRLPSFIDERGDVAPAPLRPGTYVISATLLHTLDGAAAGPWTSSYELAYRGLRPEMRRLEADVAQGRRPTPDEAARYRWYDGLRFARLAAWLRVREPDERITYSTLVYEVTAAELQQALSAGGNENRSDSRQRFP
jgi:hypothetical protein